MPFDRSALELIQETTLAAENKANTFTDYNVATIPKTMQIQSLEKYQLMRYRYRAEFETETLADFIAYVKANSGETVYINAGVMRAKTIFDIGNDASPGHCEHKASLSLDKTPEYKSVLAINNERKSQRDLAEFMEDWMPNISVIDADGNDMEGKAAINAIRRITIEGLTKSESTISNMSEKKSALELIEAKSGDAALPAWIMFDCRPYEGFKERVFAMRLSVSTAHGEPKLRVMIQKLEKHQVDMANELADWIEISLPDVKTYLGTIGTE